MYKFLNKYLFIIFITSFIISCGGGGGGGDSTPDVPLPSINLSSQILLPVLLIGLLKHLHLALKK